MRYLIAALVFVGVALAAPVPEPKPAEGRGSRGFSELRDPSGRVDPVAYALRSCAKCHTPTRVGGTRLFRTDGTWADLVPPQAVIRNILWDLRRNLTHPDRLDEVRDLNRMLDLFMRRAGLERGPSNS